MLLRRLPRRVRSRLPASIVYDLERRRRERLQAHMSYEERYPARRDVVTYEVQPGVGLSVFWKVLEIGRGPALSLFCHGQELLKFDCFGPGHGHFHVELTAPGPTRRQRLEFFENDPATQIDRSVFELTRNLEYYLQRHPWRRVRETRIDREAMARACEQARARHYLETVPELNDPAPAPLAAAGSA